ncbi:uncharacterized protein B0T23DRAFT_391877 [Neurospora hispaniola]|uniref:Uncharacterized protein n=1 Tax=Neurospora hispaniola TaxID=588809 RepID=A0AAJ0IFE0_9PEZI|nr:hypothetical protein B0T23DRAFT_391877 [Neurospora hispaniola]
MPTSSMIFNPWREISRISAPLRASDGASFPNWASGLMSRGASSGTFEISSNCRFSPSSRLNLSRLEDGVMTRRDLWAHQPERLESRPNAAAKESRGHDCV